MPAFALGANVTYASGNISSGGGSYNMVYATSSGAVNFTGAYFQWTITLNDVINLGGNNYVLSTVPPGFILTTNQTANLSWIPFGFSVFSLYGGFMHHAGAISAAGQQSSFLFSNSIGSIAFPVPDNTSLYFLMFYLINLALPSYALGGPGGATTLSIPQGTGQSFVYRGNYVVAPNSSKWIITNLTRSGPNYFPGDQVKITTPDNSYDFSTITKVTIGGFVISQFLIQTPPFIVLVIPPIPPIPPGNQPITITNPTQFSGEATLGVINILIANSSGIYKVTPGKTHDTTYTTIGSNQTQDSAIPNPFIKTGFIGG